MNEENNADFNNLDNYEIQNNNTPCYKNKTFIIIFITTLVIILLGGLLLLFLLRKSGGSNCKTGDEDKCLTCKKNKCSSCNIGYKLEDGKCIINYSFRAEYMAEVRKQTIRLINEEYLNYTNELIIDGKKRDDILAEYTFNSTGSHIVYFLFNLSGMTSLDYMFGDLENMVSINFTSLFNTENITSMDYMFSGLKKVLFLNLSTFNGNNLNSMEFMFHHCNSLKSVDFSNFYAPKLGSVESLFQESFDLEYANFTDFNAPNLENMKNMFYMCNSLQSLDLSSFNSKTITNLDEMCFDCWSLKYLNMKNIKTNPNFSYSQGIFLRCYNLTYIDISSFSTEDGDVIMFDNNLPEKGEIFIKSDFYDLIKSQIPEDWNKTIYP